MLSLPKDVQAPPWGLLTSSIGNPGGRISISLLACQFNKKGREKLLHLLSKRESEKFRSLLPALFESSGVYSLTFIYFATFWQISVTPMAYYRNFL